MIPSTDMYQNIHIEKISDARLEQKEVLAGMLRLDMIHPVVSGNKIFKLSPYLNIAAESGTKQILTFGGPYSNHLHATAYEAKQRGMSCVGLVRGKPPLQLSITLEECLQMGMKLRFLEGQQFDNIDASTLAAAYPNTLIIPHGGYGRSGAIGASEIMNLPGVGEYNIIMAACGTGTMGAGLISVAKDHQKIILISVLKNNHSITEEINALLPEETRFTNYTVEHRFHLGGYAKKNNELFSCMNGFYSRYSIPTDFVYTGKLVFAFEQLIAEDFFSRGSKILLIHSGGLQGNRSLISGELNFAGKDYLCC
jgi:1-aminocyclopropane-1-carboxylate deaminase